MRPLSVGSQANAPFLHCGLTFRGAERMKVTLARLDKSSAPLEFVLEESPLTVGRGADAEVRLWNPTVSRRHCQIEEVEGVLIVRDLESKNGTYVNGHQVSEARLLPGHRLTMGEAGLLVSYEIDAASSRVYAVAKDACPC